MEHSVTPENISLERCTCATGFVVFYRTEENSEYSSRELNESNSTQQMRNVENRKNCRCDCENGNATCEGYKEGREGFSIDDRR